MKPTEAIKTCEWADENLDAYLDDELSGEERRHFEAHIAGCARCAKDLAFAREIQTTLHALPALPSPESIGDFVEQLTRGDNPVSIRQPMPVRLFDWLAQFWRPAIAFAMLLALLVMSNNIERPPAIVPAPNPETIALAQVEIKWTFAYINKVSRRAGLEVRDQIIGPEVVRPLLNAFEQAIEVRP